MKFMLLLGAALTFSMLCLPSKALAANWYVSRNATGTVRDGKTWATAWGDFSYQYNPAYRIDWSQVQAGDTIYVDAGTAPPPGYSKTTFYGPLVVQKSGVRIQLSNEPGRNGGDISIQTSASGAIGIDLATYDVSNVTIDGGKWVPDYSKKYRPKWSVMALSGTGIAVGKNGSGNVLRSIRTEWCNTGLKLNGAQTYCYYLMINDNMTNVSVTPQAGSGASSYWGVMSSMAWCWIFNSSTRRTVGISSNFDPASNCELSLGYCVLGPGLSKSVEANGAKDKLSMSYNLFINPSIAQLQVNQAPKDVRLTYNILFMTPLNQNGLPHSCLKFNDAPTISVFGDAIYGGVVDVVGTRLLGMYNKQFKTSGNTVVVSPTQEDPKFASDVSLVPNAASFDQLMNLDFTPSNNTPGTPYAMKSVADMLNRVPK